MDISRISFPVTLNGSKDDSAICVAKNTRQKTVRRTSSFNDLVLTGNDCIFTENLKKASNAELVLDASVKSEVQNINNTDLEDLKRQLAEAQLSLKNYKRETVGLKKEVSRVKALRRKDKKKIKVLNKELRYLKEQATEDDKRELLNVVKVEDSQSSLSVIKVQKLKVERSFDHTGGP